MGLEGSILIYLEYISVSAVETLFFLSDSTSELEGSEITSITYIIYSDPLEFFSFSSHQLLTPLLMCSSTKTITFL